MAGTGGKREGAGRRPGPSKNTLLRRKIQDYFAEADVKKLIAAAKKQAYEKPEIMKFLLEQIFGKAPQQLEIGGKDGSPIKIIWENGNNNPNTIPAENMGEETPR